MVIQCNKTYVVAYLDLNLGILSRTWERPQVLAASSTRRIRWHLGRWHRVTRRSENSTGRNLKVGCFLTTTIRRSTITDRRFFRPPPIFSSTSMLVLVFGTAVLIVGILWERVLRSVYRTGKFRYTPGGPSVDWSDRRPATHLQVPGEGYMGRQHGSACFYIVFIHYCLIFRKRRSHAGCLRGGRRYSTRHARTRIPPSTTLHSPSASQSTAAVHSHKPMYVRSEI